MSAPGPRAPQAGRGVAAAWHALAQAEPLEIALRVALLVLLLDGSPYWSERVPVTLAAALGLLFPSLARSRALWLVLLAATSWPLVWNWPFSDNHDYLTAFFCLAVLCALSSADPARALAVSARGLLAVTFLFATLWKVGLSPEFRDGRFFRVTLLTDTRFQNLAVLAGGLSRGEWEANDRTLDAYLAGGTEWTGLVEPPRLRRLASALTVVAGLLEGALALAFLWPGRGGPARARDPLLLAFGVTTFAFATVRGFGWLLMTLGLAQCGRGRPWTRLAYVAAFLLIEVYRSVPWSSALVEALGRI